MEPAIESLLVRLRNRIRAYVWVEGIAVALALLGLSFWASLAFDWVFEPPVPLRIALLGLVGLLLLYVVFRYILRRAFVRLANRNMAVLLERRFTGFRDSLLTTVELSEQPESGDYSPDMFAYTQQAAVAGTSGVALGKVFNAGRLARRISLGVLLVVSVIAFGIGAAEAFGIWARRSLLLSEEVWPRNTHLVVEGFEDNPVTKIARGGDLTLLVKADAGPERVVPETVEVRMMTSDRRREKMSREGVAVPGEDEFQNYSYKFKSVLESLDFYVVGGDDRRGPFHLEVVDSPTISEMVLHCEYPAYMNRAPREIPVTGVMHLPVGTEITIAPRPTRTWCRCRSTIWWARRPPSPTSWKWPGQAGQGGASSNSSCRRSKRIRRSCSRCWTPTAYAAATRSPWRWARCRTNRRKSACSSRESARRSPPTPGCRWSAKSRTITAWPRPGSTFT